MCTYDSCIHQYSTQHTLHSQAWMYVCILVPLPKIGYVLCLWSAVDPVLAVRIINVHRLTNSHHTVIHSFFKADNVIMTHNSASSSL